MNSDPYGLGPANQNKNPEPCNYASSIKKPSHKNMINDADAIASVLAKLERCCTKTCIDRVPTCPDIPWCKREAKDIATTYVNTFYEWAAIGDNSGCMQNGYLCYQWQYIMHQAFKKKSYCCWKVSSVSKTCKNSNHSFTLASVGEPTEAETPRPNVATGVGAAQPAAPQCQPNVPARPSQKQKPLSLSATYRECATVLDAWRRPLDASNPKPRAKGPTRGKDEKAVDSDDDSWYKDPLYQGWGDLTIDFIEPDKNNPGGLADDTSYQPGFSENHWTSKKSPPGKQPGCPNEHAIPYKPGTPPFRVP